MSSACHFVSTKCVLSTATPKMTSPQVDTFLLEHAMNKRVNPHAFCDEHSTSMSTSRFTRKEVPFWNLRLGKRGSVIRAPWSVFCSVMERTCFGIPRFLRRRGKAFNVIEAQDQAHVLTCFFSKRRHILQWRCL